MMKRIYLKYGLQMLFYSLLLSFRPVFAQVDSSTISGKDDHLKTNPEKSLHSLYGGFGYGSNMIYLGSTISRNQPYAYSAISYGLNDELYLSASAFHLTDLDPFLAFYSFSLSYSHTFNSWFDVSVGLYRYQVDESLTETLFNHFIYTDLTLGFDWKLIYSKLSVGGLFSYENQVYYQVKNSRYFQTPDFFKGKANISFDPYVNLLFGDLVKIETSTETYYTSTQPYRRWGQQDSNSYTSTYTTSSKTFNLIEIDLGLPVALNLKSMTIEAEASYVFPGYSDQNYPGPEGFVFLLSGFFKIF